MRNFGVSSLDVKSLEQMKEEREAQGKLGGGLEREGKSEYDLRRELLRRMQVEQNTFEQKQVWQTGGGEVPSRGEGAWSIGSGRIPEHHTTSQRPGGIANPPQVSLASYPQQQVPNAVSKQLPLTDGGMTTRHPAVTCTASVRQQQHPGDMDKPTAGGHKPTQPRKDIDKARPVLAQLLAKRLGDTSKTKPASGEMLVAQHLADIYMPRPVPGGVALAKQLAEGSRSPQPPSAVSQHLANPPQSFSVSSAQYEGQNMGQYAEVSHTQSVSSQSQHAVRPHPFHGGTANPAHRAGNINPPLGYSEGRVMLAGVNQVQPERLSTSQSFSAQPLPTQPFATQYLRDSQSFQHPPKPQPFSDGVTSSGGFNQTQAYPDRVGMTQHVPVSNRSGMDHRGQADTHSTHHGRNLDPQLGRINQPQALADRRTSSSRHRRGPNKPWAIPDGYLPLHSGGNDQHSSLNDQRTHSARRRSYSPRHRRSHSATGAVGDRRRGTSNPQHLAEDRSRLGISPPPSDGRFPSQKGGGLARQTADRRLGGIQRSQPIPDRLPSALHLGEVEESEERTMREALAQRLRGSGHQSLPVSHERPSSAQHSQGKERTLHEDHRGSDHQSWSVC